MKILQNVPEVIFQKGAYGQLSDILFKLEARGFKKGAFIVDDFFKGQDLLNISIRERDKIYWVNVDYEPKIKETDSLVASIKQFNPDFIIGMGGGSVMDIAKGVSILLTNPGSCADYQGWNLVKNPPIYKIGIPTLSGTGSEVSRTCIFTSPEKKQGINDDASRFDMVLLDPNLISSVPNKQRFYTGMDCYIHCVESLRGTFLNAFSRAYAEKALDLCFKVFYRKEGGNDDLMAASYFGGCSIVYAEVGVCHALSYGLSFILGYHHGEANTIVFDYLDEFYPEDIIPFREMLGKNNIEIPRRILKNVTEVQLDKMVSLAYLMDKPLTNALGPNWKQVLTPGRIKDIYRKM